MVFKFLDAILDYFKAQPYWSKIQPLLAFLSLYITTQVLAYEFLQWQYRLSPSLSLYCKSYIFRQITLAFTAMGLIVLIISRGKAWQYHTLGQTVRQYARLALYKAALIGLVLLCAAPLFLSLSPRAVSHIRIQFLREPDINKYALVYIIYELNKLQKNWYFEVDFDIFNTAALSTRDRERCHGANESLCYAELLADRRPFIGLTTERLHEDSFWQNRGSVSVISTADWQRYAPPGTYEFLTYSLLVNSILIHLNAHCRGLPAHAFQESRLAYGDLFQFSPRRQAMKSVILAAHLSRRGELLLFNCFGAEYMSTCARLLTLEWFHTPKIIENLKKSFGVEV
jgi:hypothetical protein